jgi:hypothetical protein
VSAPRPLNPHCAMVVVHVTHNRWSYAVWAPGEWVYGTGDDDGSYAVLTAIGVARALEELEHEFQSQLMLAVSDGIIRRLVKSGERVFQPTMFGRAMASVVDGLERLEERGCTVVVLDPGERRDTWLAAKHLAARARTLGYPGDERESDGFEESEPFDPAKDWEEAGFPTAAVWAEWASAGWDGAMWTAGAAYLAGLDPHTALTADDVLNPASTHAEVE